MNDLSVLVPQVEVSTRMGTVVVKPFRFKQFAKAIATLGKYSFALQAEMAVGDMCTALLAYGAEDDIEQLMGYSIKFQDGGAVPVENLEADDGVRVLTAVIEVNWDFFVQHVQPLVGDLTARLKPGAMPSSDSSATDTP